MEADWEVEIGGDAPVIDAAWSGFVDLRRAPNRIAEIGESAYQPGLAEALTRLNAGDSPVWTAKCDVWQVEAFDYSELDASPESAVHAVACYVDLLPREDRPWTLPQSAVDVCKALCATLHEVPARSCRVDLVVRAACVTPNIDGLGVTAYVTTCGPTADVARERLSAVLLMLVDAIVGSRSEAEGSAW